MENELTKKRIRTLLLFAAFAICAMVAPQTAFAAEQTTIEVNTSSEFNDAVSTVNAATSGEYTIRLTNDIKSGGASFDSTCPITILGNGHTITINEGCSLFVGPGAQLNLGAEDGSDTLMISGGNAPACDGPGMLYIEGSCSMYPGVTVADRNGDNYYGGGVSVCGGNFHMYGGTIDKCGIVSGSMCYGGGVGVVKGGSFIMDGGEITNCFATSTFKASDYGLDSRIISSVGGGVCILGGSSFIMNGGTISHNTANEMGGGVAVFASIDEIDNGRWGNLESSVQILGGTICDNQANDGAGVLASAYFYSMYHGLSTNTQAKETGLFIENATINNNTANKDEGYGAGVLAVMLASPAKAEIRSCSITENGGAVGAGVTSYGSFTNLTIDDCVITGNHATTYGGGFAAESNSGQNADTVVTNTKLCNNTADEAASDVYLDNSPLKLQSAQTMDSLYQGKPNDVTGKKIDGWYIDDENLRYSEQTKEQRSEYTGYADIASSDKTYLIAAVKPSLAKITFANEDGSLLYSEDWYAIGTKAELIKVPTPTKPSDDKYDYVFESWHTDITDVTEDAVYRAQFKKVPKKNAGNPDGDNPNKPDKDDQKPGGTDSDQKPGTGDKEPGDKNDNQSNKDNAGNNDGNNDATDSGDAPNAKNVIPATGDTTSTLVIASLLIACCALTVVVIAKRKQSNL